MSDKEEKIISRIKEVESTNLARDEIRDEVIEAKKAVEKDNDLLADRIHQNFKDNNIKSFDIVGAIGAGKTALLEKIAEKLSSQYRILVICGDITTRVDADRIEKHKAETIQINTGRECALNAYHIHKIIKNKDLENYDLVFIENVGNLICPSEFILGTDKRLIVVSTTEGEWVNKIDLKERLGTNVDKMISDAKKINPKIDVVTTSAKTGENIEKLMNLMGL